MVAFFALVSTALALPATLEQPISIEYSSVSLHTEPSLAPEPSAHTVPTEFWTETSRASSEHSKSSERPGRTSIAIPEITSSPVSNATTPWIVSKWSSFFVENAVSIRSSDVPEERASSVAAYIFDHAVSPPQYTALASEAISDWYQYGDEPDATALYDFATKANSAYNEIHDGLAYWEFVNYVNREGTIFNTNLLTQTPTSTASRNQTVNSERAARVRSEREHLTSVYLSLMANPTGSAAIATLSSVANEYYHDFTFQSDSKDGDESASRSMNTSWLEPLIMRLLGTI